MNGSFDHKHHRDFTTNSGVDHVERSSLDGVVFIGLCVTCAGILLMVIKLCYNYTRNFPVRKDSELSTVLTTNAFTPKTSHDAGKCWADVSRIAEVT